MAGRPGRAQGGRCPGRTARCDKGGKRSAQSKRGRAPQPRSNRYLPPITGYHATLMATASPHPAPPGHQSQPALSGPHNLAPSANHR